jgi:hypothetical protein
MLQTDNAVSKWKSERKLWRDIVNTALNACKFSLCLTGRESDRDRGERGDRGKA